MTLLRLGLAFALVLGGASGCVVGGPERASDIQNVHAISDDISAVTMTQSQSAHTHDPNQQTTLPNSYSTVQSH
jgi:hypothetical protein